MAKRKVISLHNVSKIYTMGEVTVPALKDVSADVEEGEFVAVMGPSGSGKSTMMNLVGCLDYPSTGTVKLDGVDISELDESDLAQARGRKIGFVFQRFNLVAYLSAVENVALPLLFRGFSRQEREEIARKQLERVGLGHRLDHLPSQLSGGEQQRVAIARAIAGEPELILADEPTGNLDSKSGEGIMALLDELHGEGKTIVMVTHDAILAKHAKRVIRLKDGAVVK
jgi:putative ABC transport system ATP-binding protein